MLQMLSIIVAPRLSAALVLRDETATLSHTYTPVNNIIFQSEILSFFSPEWYELENAVLDWPPPSLLC